MSLDPQALRTFVGEVLRAYDAPATYADRVAHALVDADLCGHSSHGVRQIPFYVEQILRRELDVHADLTTVDDRGSFVLCDGGFGFGHVVAMEATELAVARASSVGAAVVAVRNANHIGRLGEYTSFAGERGCVAMLFVNNQGSVDQQVAPFGAAERRLTNNPISFAAPGGIVLDIALSVAAEGRVHLAAEQGTPVPEGWILDARGAPSTDPRDYLAGGSLLPVGGVTGGYKGYGLIVAIEAIVGLLTGGGMVGRGWTGFSNAFVLVCVHPGTEAAEAYDEEFERFTHWVKSASPLPGREILLPGEPEANARARTIEIELPQSTRDALTDVARARGVDVPSF